MLAGSISLYNMSLAARVGFDSPSTPELPPDDIADLVGLSVHEVVDLLGTSPQEVNAVIAGGSATVAHVRRLLTSIREIVHTHGQRKPFTGLPAMFEDNVGALTAVMQAEFRKSEASLHSCIAALPELARACTYNQNASALIQQTFLKMPSLRKLMDQVEDMLSQSLDF